MGVVGVVGVVGGVGVVGVVGVVVAAAVAVVVVVGVEVLVIVVVAAVAAVGGNCVYPTLSHYSLLPLLLPLPLLQSAWRLRLLVCHCSHCSTEQNGTTYQQILLYLSQPNT